MASTQEYVRKTVGKHLKPTPQNKGLELNIRLKFMDNGIVEVNGDPMGRGFTHPVNGFATMRFVAQIVEEAVAVSVKRQKALAD